MTNLPLNASLVKSLCDQEQIGPTQLRKLLGLSQTHAGRLLKGQVGTTADKVNKLAERLRVAPESLVQGGSLTKRRPGWEFNARKGLHSEGAPLVGPSRRPFQNFLPDEEQNLVCLSYLWT